MDAYLEEELYHILTYCIQNPAQTLEQKRRGLKRLAVSCTQMEGSMQWKICLIQLNLEESKDAKPYRAWWNNISGEWRY